MKSFKFLFLTFLVSLFSFNVFSQEADITEKEPVVVINETADTQEKIEIETESVVMADVDVNEESESGQEPVSEQKTESEGQPENVLPVVENIPEKTTEIAAKEENKEERFIPIDDDLEDENASGVTEEKQRPKWLDEILNSDIPFFNRLDFIFGFTPTIYVNAQDQTMGAPSPIVYPVYFGFHWPNDTFISLQPSFKFFKNYYLVNDGMVLPAEMESRIVDAWSCIFNVPVVVKINFWDRFNFKAFGGLAFLIRIPTLASGIEPTDYGYYGSAEDDYKYIKKWLVNSWRFLYLSAGADVMINLNENLQIGPEFSIYFPLGAVFSDWSFDALMASIGFKVAF